MKTRGSRPKFIGILKVGRRIEISHWFSSFVRNFGCKVDEILSCTVTSRNLSVTNLQCRFELQQFAHFYWF